MDREWSFALERHVLVCRNERGRGDKGSGSFLPCFRALHLDIIVHSAWNVRPDILFKFLRLHHPRANRASGQTLEGPFSAALKPIFCNRIL